MTTNRPRGLWLALDEPVERECPACVSIGAHEQDNRIGGNCCHGTGTVHRRLVGMVKVDAFAAYDDRGNAIVDFETDDSRYSAESPEELMKIILAAHINGTLPQELYAGDEPGDWRLREVEDAPD